MFLPLGLLEVYGLWWQYDILYSSFPNNYQNES